MVRDGGNKRDGTSVNEYRCRERAVVKMRDAHDVGVIGEEYIAIAKRVDRKALKNRRHEHER